MRRATVVTVGPGVEIEACHDGVIAREELDAAVPSVLPLVHTVSPVAYKALPTLPGPGLTYAASPVMPQPLPTVVYTMVPSPSSPILELTATASLMFPGGFVAAPTVAAAPVLNSVVVHEPVTVSPEEFAAPSVRSTIVHEPATESAEKFAKHFGHCPHVSTPVAVTASAAQGNRFVVDRELKEVS